VRTIVLGVGVIVITTAHFLVRDGHEVTVVERQTLGMSNPWAPLGGPKLILIHTWPPARAVPASIEGSAGHERLV